MYVYYIYKVKQGDLSNNSDKSVNESYYESDNKSIDSAETIISLKQGFWLTLCAAFSMLYVKCDMIILGIYRAESEIGDYAAAYNIVMVIGLAPQIMLLAIFPKLSIFGSSITKII